METLAQAVAQLAYLLHQRNTLDVKIAQLIHHPADAEWLGKFIATKVFDVRLLRSAAHPDLDGHFLSGPLAGRSVKVQWYSRQDGTLDLIPNARVNEYLVFTGSPILPEAPADLTPTWRIEQVYLFDAAALVQQLQQLGLAIGAYTCLPQAMWEAAEIYPQSCSPRLPLREEQTAWLRLFGAAGADLEAASERPVAVAAETEEAQPAAEVFPGPAAPPPNGASAPQASALVEEPGPGSEAPSAADMPPIAMRRWLVPAQAPVDSEAEPSADLDAATAASSQPPGLTQHPSSDDLPATAPLPPLPPGERFPRPSSLSGPAPEAQPTAPSLPEEALFEEPLPAESSPEERLPVELLLEEPLPVEPLLVEPMPEEPTASNPPRPVEVFPVVPETPAAPARAPGGGMPKKYLPLENYLRAIPPHLDRLSLPFTQVEEIINDHLPGSALKTAAWWSNVADGKHPQAFSWLNSGWEVDDVDLAQGWVTLCRSAQPE